MSGVGALFTGHFEKKREDNFLVVNNSCSLRQTKQHGVANGVIRNELRQGEDTKATE
jgi:hypothetical protein